MKQSAGTLLYKEVNGEIQVLLVHPSGNYNKRSPWGIPKGIPDEGEELEAAARRETQEETGIICGELVSLGHVDYTKSRKRIFCWAGKAPVDQVPRCASWEIDKAEFVSLIRAKEIIHSDQSAFIDRLMEMKL
jgi:predicted NUDIX family NTP pyrophosphohydrolase